MFAFPISSSVLDKIVPLIEAHHSDHKRLAEGEVPSSELPGAVTHGSCRDSDCDKWSRTASHTIKSGEDKKPPIGPQSQVQNASERNTASAFSSSRRPIIVGVTK